MKRLVLILLAALLAVSLYAATAPAGQQAVTPKQFKALQNRVTALEAVVKLCVHASVPTARFNDYVGVDQNGQEFKGNTALDLAEGSVTPNYFLLDVGEACSKAIGGLRARALTHTRR